MLEWLITPSDFIIERIILCSDFIRGIFLIEAVLETMVVDNLKNTKSINLENTNKAYDGYKELEKFCIEE